MTVQLIVAYSLIALMVLAAAAAIWWIAYHSRQRIDDRRRAKLASEAATAMKATAAPDTSHIPLIETERDIS